MKVWKVTFDNFAAALAEAVIGGPRRNVTGSPDVRRLGTIAVGDGTRDLFLVRGSNHQKADETGMFTEAVVIALADTIAMVGIHNAFSVVLASEICILDDSGLYLDLTVIAGHSALNIPVAAARHVGNVFIKNGDVWEIAFEGKSTTLRHTVGLHYIEYLIARQGKSHMAVHMVWDKNGIFPDLTVDHSFGELAEDDIVAVRGAIGEGAEKARSSVSQSVGNALKKISQAHPALFQHLKATIELGRECVYRPPEPVVWKTTPK